MGLPSLWMTFRQVIGRALREAGQALDRVGVRGKQHATTTRLVGDDPYIFNDHFSRHRHQMPLLKRGKPIVSPQVAYLAPNSTLIGSVRVGPGSSIWYGAILRADACENGSSFKNSDEKEMNNIWTIRKPKLSDGERNPGGGIFIGENSNVQDGCLVTARAKHTIIGNGVTVGHLAQIHSATIHDHCLIGMGSVLNEGVVVETESFIGAGAVVPAGTHIASGELWVGNPAHRVRSLTDKERAKLHYQADEYVKVAMGQHGVMELGGNMPESLLKFTILGNASEAAKELSPGEQKQQHAQVTSGTFAANDLEELEADDEPLSPDIAAKLRDVTLPWEDEEDQTSKNLQGAALRKSIARQKMNKIARQRLEAIQAARKKKK